ncbi:MAG: cellulase family glycosylhydrolase [Candidatus Sericytochromatia bacterium]|nr:cellulase family glycosylhydrolase [Candidatus Sericytochromatia bacterium]
MSGIVVISPWKESAAPTLARSLPPPATAPPPSKNPTAAEPIQPADQLQLSTGSTKATALPAQPLKLPHSGFVKNNHGQFSVEGKPFRYVGTNMYSLAKEKPEVQEKMLKDAAEHGFTVVRFWAYENYGATPEILQRLCDLAAKYQLKLIPCLADRWVMSEADRKDDHFYKAGFERSYLPRVLDMTEKLKDRPEIMLWELVNEPETEEFESMYHFSKTVSEAIKKTNPNHLISLGTIGGIGDKFGSQLSRLSTESFRKLYAIPSLDAASIHNYSYDATLLERLDILARFSGEHEKGAQFGKADQVLSWASRKVDNWALNTLGVQIQNPLTLRGRWDQMNQENIQIAQDLGKPLYIGEVGFKQTHGEDRQKLLRLDIARSMQAGVQGYTLWSYQAQGKSMDGHDYGFDDRDNLAPVVKEWNQYFSAQAADPELAKSLKLPAGDNFSGLHQMGNAIQSTAQGAVSIMATGAKQVYRGIEVLDRRLGDTVPDLLYGWLN